jgi:hypothetical protein
VATPTLKLPASYSLAISPGNRLLAALGRNVVVADMETRKRVYSSHPLSHPSDAAFSRDGTLLAIKSTWGEVVVLSAADGSRLMGHRPKQQDEGAPLHFSADDQYLVEGSWSGEIRVRNVHDLDVESAFSFPEEMIKVVSPDSAADTWLFAHQPCLREGLPDRFPYLTLWQWPLREPKHRIPSNFDILDAAALAPSGDYIAVVGFSRAKQLRELRLLTPTGRLIASTPIPEQGGTGSLIRWSNDSMFAATLVKDGILIVSIPELIPVACLTARYASDLAFLSPDAEVVVGTWERGYVETFLRGDV